jgi:hypothetical protein
MDLGRFTKPDPDSNQLACLLNFRTAKAAEHRQDISYAAPGAPFADESAYHEAFEPR